MHRINFGDMFIIQPSFFMHPKTGEVLFHLYTAEGGDLHLNGALDLTGAHGSVVDARMLGNVKMGVCSPNVNGHRFTRNGNQLTEFSTSTFYMAPFPVKKADKLSVMRWYSMDGRFKKERELSFDHIAMIKKLYPVALLTEVKAARPQDFIEWMCQKTLFRGHSFKYTFVSNTIGVAAVKHFDRWVKDGMDARKNRQCFMSYSNAGLFVQTPQLATASARMHCVLGSMLYYTVTDDRHGNERLHRLELGDQFKDYRTCGHCGIDETRKRHNGQGKRTAQFKVCRQCKKLKFHHQWWKFPCHFCSDECMKKGWKKHKKQHIR